MGNDPGHGFVPLITDHGDSSNATGLLGLAPTRRCPGMSQKPRLGGAEPHRASPEVGFSWRSRANSRMAPVAVLQSRIMGLAHVPEMVV